jgi:ketosteroid isomerase-like protein
VSEDRVEILREIYDEWGRGNLSAGADLYDADILFIPREGMPDADTRRYLGVEGIRQFMRAWLSAWNDFTVTAEEFIPAGDSVVASICQRGVGKESGAPGELRYSQVWSFRGPSVIRLQQYVERAEALAAVGLPADYQSAREGLPIGAAYDAIVQLDADALIDLCHPTVRFESRITGVDDSSYDGHDGIRRYLANLGDAFEWMDVQGSDVIAEQDRAVATNHFRARGRGSGLEVEQRFFVAARGHEGKLSWWGLFDTRAEALAAVGLSE